MLVPGHAEALGLNRRDDPDRTGAVGLGASGKISLSAATRAATMTRIGPKRVRA